MPHVQPAKLSIFAFLTSIKFSDASPTTAPPCGNRNCAFPCANSSSLPDQGPTRLDHNNSSLRPDTRCAPHLIPSCNALHEGACARPMHELPARNSGPTNALSPDPFAPVSMRRVAVRKKPAKLLKAAKRARAKAAVPVPMRVSVAVDWFEMPLIKALQATLRPPTARTRRKQITMKFVLPRESFERLMKELTHTDCADIQRGSDGCLEPTKITKDGPGPASRQLPAPRPDARSAPCPAGAIDAPRRV